MEKCPECKEEIEHLEFTAKVEHSGIYQKDSRNEEEWSTKNYGDWSEIKFFCPKCQELIAENQDEADKFFN